MRDYLSVIHDEFALLYHAEESDYFAMDIEYKITSDNRLIIKQARPWASFVPDRDSEETDQGALGLKIFPNPAFDNINVVCNDCNLRSISISNVNGQLVRKIRLGNPVNLNSEMNIGGLPSGFYLVNGISKNNDTYYSEKFVKY
jgi:hypothetical protein